MNEDFHYDLEMKEEPTASVHIPFQDAKDSEVFSQIYREFAQAHGLAEVQLRAISFYPNPQWKTLAIYQSSNVLVSGFCVLAAGDSYGQSRISVLRREFAPAEFKRMADDYLARFRRAFSNRILESFEDNRK